MIGCLIAALLAVGHVTVQTVEDKPGYNAWPMIQAVNGRLVCLYSVGLRHSIGDGERSTWAKTSADGGKTWSKAVAVADDPMRGEVPVGKGLDENGAALFWVRCCGERPSHDLYRTIDGAAFERVASLGALDPVPTQITDVFKVPGEGLMALWFYCTYGGKGSNSWGTLVSTDNGKTWKQRTVEGGLPNGGIGKEEPSAVYLGGGRILGITRGGVQGQITSTDSGRTWTRRATNIKDVCCSTPSLIYDPATGVVKNYYYQRGAGLLKCRTVKADDVFDNPLAWPEPAVLAVGGKIAMDTGNANATRLGGTDCIAYYSGKAPDTAVLVALSDASEVTPFSLDSVFTDHMVLQRNRPIRFSGSAAADATIEVAIDGAKGSAKADGNGRWTVELPARKEGGPYAVTVVRREGGEAKETLRLEDVLVGEVWLGSGQSNMEFWVLGENLESPKFYSLTNGEDVAATKDPLLRVLYVPHAVAPEGPRQSAKLGWKRAETREANGRMSAVAFLFGKELRRRLGPNVPVGIASAAWGGTEIETWIPEAQFKAQENEFDLARLAAARLAGDTDARKEALRKAIYAKRGIDLRAWSDLLRATGEMPSAPLADFDGPGVTVKRIAVDVPADWAGHAAELHLEGVSDIDRTRFGGVEVGATGVDTPSYWSVARNYRIASVKAGCQELEIEIEHHCGRARLGEKLTLKDLTTGETLDLGKLPRTSEVKLIGNPMRIGYRPPDPYNGVHGDPAEDPQVPTSLFNGMIAPLTAMNIGGVIWYQGCANMADARRYRALQSDLVDGWRTAFRHPEMPFLITQVSTYSRQTPAQRQADDFWEAETVPFKVLGFGPLRLAQDAMSAYPHVGVACTIDIGDHSDIHPPNKQEVARRLGHEAMRVAFGDKTARPAPRAKLATQTAEGVVVSFSETGRGLVMDGGKKTFHPHHFALAGRDGVFSWAEGRLRDDGTVLVTSETVREPWYVQYCMSGCPVEVGFRRADDALPVMPFELEVRKPGVIRPGEMWRDTTGLPIHAHGGSILVAEGKFWWYGENKEGVDGRSKTWHRGVRAYTSENLIDWTDEGVIIEYGHEACMDRPHILYNAKTKKFVAWLKVMHGDRQTRTILTADRMRGPWKVEKDNFLPAGLSSGDFDLVAAEDGRAYAYFERPHDALVSAELTDDYLDLKPETVKVDFPNQKPPYTREAPAHFLKDGKHYLFTSGTSWYYPNPTEVAEADGWLGPWRKLGDAHPDDRSRTSFHSQISSVFKVPGKDLYIALADRWLPNQMDITYPAVENAFRRWFKHGGSDDALYDFLQTQRNGRKGDTCDARYVWLPVVFKDGVPRVEWRDEWSPGVAPLEVGNPQILENGEGSSVAGFCRRAEMGERLTVVFFGGSLSWGANATDPNRTSWRARIGERLEAAYPKAHFKFIDAAIGGTGSGLGIFRLERDVLKYNPDLVFIDWAVNDGAYGANDDASASYEGILRGLLAKCPKCVPVQVIFPDRKTVEKDGEKALARRAEHIAIGEAFGLARADVLWELRRRHAEGRVDLNEVWPPIIGDNTHPFDEGYALYADIIWDKVFANPSSRNVKVPDDWMFEPKYRHVVRANLAGRDDLPNGWCKKPCSMRAGTFDFLCSRWQDGLAVASEGASALKGTFRGEVLLLYGESSVDSSACEVYVDGKRVASQDTSGFGRWFPPSAWLVWQIGTKFDPDIEHSLEIRPVFKSGEKKELRLGSICVAGRRGASFAIRDSTLQAHEVTVRKGLGKFFAKCVPGAAVRVAFFGGSITEADGWKTFTMENLRKRFPETKFELIDAALGGTGSDYGVYRLAKDVLPYKPDLMFVEFLVNDGDSNRLRAIEGYVRNYYTAFPESDIVFTYTLSKQTAPIVQRGLLPKGAEAFERVAERYGIPSIAMGLRAAEMANRGELVWNKGDTQVKALAGKETEKDRPEDETGPIVFLSDGAHPYRETGHRLYAEAVARGLDAIAAAKLPPVDRHALPEPLEPAMGTVRFYTPEAAQEAGLVLKGAGWRNDTTIQTSWWKNRPSFYKFYKSSWRSGPGEGAISFRFKGASVLFAPLYGPGTGAAEITVDGKSRRVDFFDMYSAFWRMGPYLICDGLDPNAVHEVTIHNLPDACDREKVMREAGRGADYEKHKADFQAPQELMFCGLYVEGEIVK